MSEVTKIYIGIKPCGCKVAACVDKPEWANETAQTVGNWICSGYTVQSIELGPEEFAPIARCVHEEDN